MKKAITCPSRAILTGLPSLSGLNKCNVFVNDNSRLQTQSKLKTPESARELKPGGSTHWMRCVSWRDSEANLAKPSEGGNEKKKGERNYKSDNYYSSSFTTDKLASR